MNKAKEIMLPKREYAVLILNVGGAWLFLLESNFFRKPLSDPMVLITLCFWISAFCLSITRIAVSPEGIRVCLWKIPLRSIHYDKVAYVELVEWEKVLHVIFEIGKCPKYADIDAPGSLFMFFVSHMFSTIDYVPPQKRKDEVLEQICNVFEDKMQK